MEQIAGSRVRRAVAVTVGAAVGALAAMFGLFHGHAHGAELPVGASAVAYVAGFVFTTAALLAAAVVIGCGARRLPTTRIAAGSAMSVAGMVLLMGA